MIRGSYGRLPQDWFGVVASVLLPMAIEGRARDAGRVASTNKFATCSFISPATAMFFACCAYEHFRKAFGYGGTVCLQPHPLTSRKM